MDDNKAKKLEEIGYKVRQTCGLCVHGGFPSPESDWGTCGLHDYSHLKHSDKLRQLSICKSGSCPNFIIDPDRKALLHGFVEFIDIK